MVTKAEIIAYLVTQDYTPDEAEKCFVTYHDLLDAGNIHGLSSWAIGNSMINFHMADVDKENGL